MKTWRRAWKKHGVSPVIATMLLLAITVVLAAILYIMVSGFGVNTRPTAAFLPPDKMSQTEWWIKVGDVYPGRQGISNFKVMALNNTTMATGPDALFQTYSATYNDLGGNTLNVSFRDLTNDYLSGGDFFRFNFSKPPKIGCEYTLVLLWAHDDAELTSKSFTV